MLFGILYRSRGAPDDSSPGSLALFSAWTPPFEFKGHWAFASGGGGMAVVEADDAEALLRGTSAFQPFFDFEVHPILDFQAAAPILSESSAWRDSLG